MDFNVINVVEKPWGREIHFAVEDVYVGKILEVKGGRRLSLQYHQKKKETMYVLEGRIRLTLGTEVEDVGRGKSVTLNPGVHHRVEALEDTRIIEVSTSHIDDVVRIEDDHGRTDGRRHPLHRRVHVHMKRIFAGFVKRIKRVRAGS
jgi:mannose-6-phosphate isomerase-like protein (cupin superfamily)